MSNQSRVGGLLGSNLLRINPPTLTGAPLCVPSGIKLNPECAMANILKGRGRAVPALTHTLHSTLRPIAWACRYACD
jgi:hypothetical protein